MDLEINEAVFEYFKKLTRHNRLSTEELAADAVSGTVSVDQTLFLLTSSLLIIGVTKESIRTGADRFVTPGLALSIATTDDWSSTRVLTLKQTRVTTNTCISISTVHIIGAARLLDTETVLTRVQWRTLTVV